MEIVHADGIFLCLEAELVSRTIDGTALNAASGHPDAESIMIVIPSHLRFAGTTQLDGRGATELPAPEDESIFKQAALLQIGQQRGDGAIDFSRKVAVILFDIVVVVPRLAGAVPELHVADAALEKAPGDQCLPSVDTVAVHLADVGRLFGEVEGVACFALHTKGEFVGMNAGIEPIIEAHGAVTGIPVGEQVELAALIACRDLGMINVFNEAAEFLVFGIDLGSLIGAGEEGGLPVFVVLDRHSAGAHRDEPGQVPVFRTESIKGPRAEAGSCLDRVTAIHEHQ